MKTLKVIGNCCCVFLAIISVCVSLAFCYYHFFVKDETIGINNINDQLAIDIKKDDELTEEERDTFEERWFMEANYYSNSKNNGIELQELKYNYFTGFNLTQDEYRSTGMQYIGNYETHSHKVNNEIEANRLVLDDFYYYDTSLDISYSGYNGQYGSVGTLLNRNERFIIKIDNRPFEIQLTGQYDVYGPLWGFLWTVKTGTVVYEYGDVFDSVFKAIQQTDKGFGDYYITLNLSQYFSVREYDMNSKKFKVDDVTDVIKNYAVLKFHYDENGAINSNQSLFGMIECNRNYNLNPQEDIDTSYWQERMLYSLNEQSKYLGKNLFTYRYSEIYNGYFIALTMDAKELFKNMSKSKVNITLNLQSQYLQNKNINIVGLDYNAFENFRIDTLTIIGNPQTIFVLDKALYNTQLQTLKYSNGITFDFAENSINNVYTGVTV